MTLVKCIDCAYCKQVSNRSYVCTNSVGTESLDKQDLYEPECCPAYKENDAYITKSQILDKIINVRIVNTSIEFTDNFNDRLHIILTFEGNNLSDCWSISLNRLESLLKTLNVNRYEDIKNSFARLRIEDTHIRDIGNIITNDWLSDQPYVPEEKKICYDEPSNKYLVDEFPLKTEKLKGVNIFGPASEEVDS